METDYQRLLSISERLALLSSVSELLEWDQQAVLPVSASQVRARQSALIAGIRHELLVSNEVRDLLGKVSESSAIRDFGPSAEAEMRVLTREYERQRRVPSHLIQELQSTISLARGPWTEARKYGRLESFVPWLKKLVALCQERAAALEFEDEPYDALLEDFEPGLTSRRLLPVLDSLEASLGSLLKAILASGQQPDSTLLSRTYGAEGLSKFTKEIAATIGFDFNAGRLDLSGSSACFGIHPNDVRLSIGANSDNPLDSFFATIHEVGHGLYHQGLPSGLWSTPIGRGASLGIHESQARWWENFLARSDSFWQYAFPKLQSIFPSDLSDVNCKSFYAAVNDVRPSLIRVEADEVTYNLHIVIRTTLERTLINGQLSVSDLSEAWNDTTYRILGIRPPNDGLGILQDVHWSRAMFGYFPTYALGNIYAAQLNHRMRQDIPDIDVRICNGEFDEPLTWLRTRIHQHGSHYLPAELMLRACDESLNVHRLTDYLESKFRPLYGL